MDDKKLQELLEQGMTGLEAGLTPAEQKELDVYNALFEALEEEAPADLSPGFSAKVAAKVRLRRERKSDIRLYSIVIFCSLFVIGAAIVAMTYWGSGAIVMSHVSRYGSILLFGSGILLLIQFLDQKLLKQQV